MTTRYDSKLLSHQYATTVGIPRDVAADRQHRLALAPRDHTASLMGDPLPGYSALDKYKQDTVSA